MSFSSHNPKIGTEIDQLDGIPVFYNGNVGNVFGRHMSKEGYNYGLRYQCVEFVKRYYHEIYEHTMPETYGHAKDFFDKSLDEMSFNEDRGLRQFQNVRSYVPKKGDILIFDGSEKNPYGHMGIVAKVENDKVEIIQQNYGKKTRHSMQLIEYNGIYTVADFGILGWLRK